jgi:hypothetical protein
MSDEKAKMRCLRKSLNGARKRVSASGKLVVISTVLLLAACARPVGDFGRAESDVLHDEVLPRAGAMIARQNKEPVSLFNLTDEEEEMRNRVWRFLIASHAKDWMFDHSVEMQRTRISKPVDLNFRTDRYYRHLRLDEYASSNGRYLRLAQDVQTDIKTLPGTFASICHVMEIERRRQVALKGLYAGNDAVKKQVLAREYENKNIINWFARAVDYRYKSYDVALNRLLVETPHEEAHAANEQLNRLAVLVGRAQNGEFCDPFSKEAYNHDKEFPFLNSRYATQMEKPTDDEYLK